MSRETPVGYLLGLKRPIPLHLGDVLTFGRDRQNSVPLDDAMASRQHAALTCSVNGVVSIKDFGSTNKTWVNDKAIPAKEEIGMSSGYQIPIGGKVFSYVAY